MSDLFLVWETVRKEKASFSLGRRTIFTCFLVCSSFPVALWITGTELGGLGDIDKPSREKKEKKRNKNFRKGGLDSFAVLSSHHVPFKLGDWPCLVFFCLPTFLTVPSVQGLETGGPKVVWFSFWVSFMPIFIFIYFIIFHSWDGEEKKEKLVPLLTSSFCQTADDLRPFRNQESGVVDGAGSLMFHGPTETRHFSPFCPSSLSLSFV